MRPLRIHAFRPLAAAAAFSLFALGLAACDIGSTDSTSAVVSDNAGKIYDFSGLYMSVSNSADSEDGVNALVYPLRRQSGKTLTWLRLLQYGAVLEGYDNAGLSWEGKISSVTTEGTASFTLSGKTTAGAGVEIIGTLYNESGTRATLNAAWLEPSFAGSIFAQATVSPVVTNSPIGSLSISPTSASFSTNDLSESFSAVGGTSPYTWSVSDSSRGTLSSSSGETVTYTSAHVEGNNTITVKDANGATATATATYTTSGPTSLSISPTTLSLSSSTYKGTFKATGGDGTYTWMVSDEALGTISPTSGSSTTYTSKKVIGTNSITVIDTDNQRASASAIYL